MWDTQLELWRLLPVHAYPEDPGRLTAYLPHFSTYAPIWATLLEPRVLISSPLRPDVQGAIRLEGFEGHGGFEVAIEPETTGTWGQQTTVDADRNWYVTLEAGYYNLRVRKGTFLVWEQRLAVGLALDGEARRDLLERFAPVLSFHPDERYLPMAVDGSYLAPSVRITTSYETVTTSGSDTQDYMAGHGEVNALLEGGETGDEWEAKTSDMSDVRQHIRVYGSVHQPDRDGASVRRGSRAAPASTRAATSSSLSPSSTTSLPHRSGGS